MMELDFGLHVLTVQFNRHHFLLPAKPFILNFHCVLPRQDVLEAEVLVVSRFRQLEGVN